MAGVVHIPWYATGFRGDALAEAVAEIAALALRFGATDYEVVRSRDDRYRILQMVAFQSKLEWERYWNSPELVDFRVKHSSWYQVPVLYVWHDRVARGGLGAAAPSRAA